MSIVVIDPNRHELEQCAAMLGRWGYNQTILCASLEEAQDVLGLGEQALRTIFGLELIVIDISHGDAFAQFVDRIRSMLFYQDIPILATSDGSRAEKMPLAFAFGATDFVSKPTEEFELRARVRSCLRLKHEIDCSELQKPSKADLKFRNKRFFFALNLQSNDGFKVSLRQSFGE
jgi:sigma-B regulation protein RsbU (phosphoserine phosphatase)